MIAYTNEWEEANRRKAEAAWAAIPDEEKVRVLIPGLPVAVGMTLRGHMRDTTGHGKVQASKKPLEWIRADHERDHAWPNQSDHYHPCSCGVPADDAKLCGDCYGDWADHLAGGSQ